MKENIQQSIVEAIKDSVQGIYPQVKIEDVVISLDLPTDSRFGDLTSNIGLQLSRTIKKSPRSIAESLLACVRDNLKQSDANRYIQEIKIEGAGFINVYFKNEYFYAQLKAIAADQEKALRLDVGEKRKVLLEFVSANPTGPLSVAHARQAAVGDSLTNILRFIGFDTTREYYLNDEGNQINLLGESIQLRLQELEGERVDFGENHYRGDYIVDIATQIRQSREKLTKQQLSGYGVDYIMGIIKKELDDFGVTFDSWFSQKKLEETPKIQEALEFLKKKGFIYEQDGATWFKSTEFGDDKDRVVIKSDGSYTYLAPDIAYHRDKLERGFGLLINLWGPDHHGYINRLKAAVMALGFVKDAIAIIIVQLATLLRSGKPVQMSTRKGEYITLREVLDEVGRDASRFFFVMRRTSSHLDFDLEVAKKQTPENPVYYVQYAHARISSILKNSGQDINSDKADVSVLIEKEEIELLKKICEFTYCLQVCFFTLDPFALTVYLQQVAEKFHRFYDTHRVLGVDPAVMQARLVLLVAAKTVIKTGLDLLGISSPEKM